MTGFPTRPGDPGCDVALPALAECHAHHLWKVTADRHGFDGAPDHEQLAAHCLTVLATGTELTSRVEATRWLTAVDALSAGATLDQVAVATDTHPDDLPVFLANWAAGQRRHGHITDARYDEVMALLRRVMPS